MDSINIIRTSFIESLLAKCFPILFLIAYVARRVKGLKTADRRSEGLFILIGLILSSVGDVFIFYQDSDKLFFTAGLVSFLFAHLFYMNAFGWKNFNLPLLITCLTMAFSSIYFIFVRFGSGMNPVLKLSCIVYTVVISLMAWRCFARVGDNETNEGSRYLLAAVGCISFVLSDTLLAINKFAFTIHRAYFYVMTTYYIAQLLISLSVPKESDGFAGNSKKKRA